MAKPPREYGSPIGPPPVSGKRPKPKPATDAQVHEALRKEFAPSDKRAEMPKKRVVRGSSSTAANRATSVPGIDAAVAKMDH